MEHTVEIVENQHNKFNIYLNGQKHTIRFEPKTVNDTYRLFLDEEEVMIPMLSKIPFIGFQHALRIDGKKYVCVLQNGVFDVTENGVSTITKKKYLSLRTYLIAHLLRMLTLVVMVLEVMFDIGDLMWPIGAFLVLSFYIIFLQERQKKINRM